MPFELLLDIVRDSAPLAALYVGAGLLLIWALWSAARFYFVRFGRLERGIVRQLPELHTRLDTVSGRIDRLAAATEAVAVTVDRIVRYLVRQDGAVTVDFFRDRSPLELTDLAKRLLEESGGRAAVDAHLEELVEKLHAEHPTSALDVQELAPFVLIDINDADAMRPVKDFIYEHPNYE
ncbi:MAG: hypothetical protein U1A16_01335, partial [Patescibacteria group bacterium]|nr:hypothetical protein [Patescibacteria group bacterium]